MQHSFFLEGGERVNVAPRIAPQGRLGRPTQVSRRPAPHVAAPPGDERGFVHKRFFRAAKGAVRGILSGSPIGAITGAIGGFVGGGKVPAEVAPAVGCPPGFFFDGRQCVPAAPLRAAIQFAPAPVQALARAAAPDPRFAGVLEPRAVTPQVDTFGEMQVGQFGVGLEPAVRDTMTRICPRGSVLGKDGLCYNRRDIPNSQREWPRGRRPLLTGGEMRCISVASSAAKKLQRKTKQLQSLGMLKKPTRRAPRRLAAGHEVTLRHESQH